MRRLSARSRLTLIYAALFLVAGTTLIVLNYSLVSAGLPVPALASDPSGDRLVTPDGGLPTDPSQEVRVAVNQSLADYRSEVLTELLYKSGLALVITLALSVLFAWLVAGRILRPLRDMTRTAQELTQGDLSLRLRVPGPRDEVRELAETFNGMLDQIETAFDQERRMVANLSHEIRTPLANQRVAIDVTLSDPTATADDLRETLSVVAKENRRSQLVSERILHLAQAQGTGTTHDEPVDLASVVQDSLAELDAGDRRVVLDIVEASARGDAVLLRRMVDNLVENAVKYNRPGGRVVISVVEDAEGVALRVENDGARMTDAEANELVLPFHRSRAARGSSGFGLGLAIVAAVVQRHDGVLRLKPREEGGLSVTVRLPGVLVRGGA